MDSKLTPVLHGLRVLELAHGIAGQYLGQLLADQGAVVLKAEPPQGAGYRSCPQFHVWNRGKRSATADLSTQDGPDLVRTLAARADVLISDFPADEADSLQLDYGSLAAANPSLVYAWLPPYGERGPFAATPPDDALASALGGMYAAQPSFSGDPVMITIPIASYTTALLAASAVCSALYARERDGAGQQVTVSLLAGVLSQGSATIIRRLEAEAPVRVRHPQGALPVYKLYKASDDWFFIACGNNVFFNKLCIALGRPELAADERFAPAPWGLINPEHMRQLTEIIAPIIAERSRDYWLVFLQANDVPCAPVLDRRDYINHPQVVNNSLRLTLDDPELGHVIMAGPPISFSGSSPVDIRPAPALGEHTVTALDGWPARPSPRFPVPSSPGATGGGPLSGVRVVDLSYYIAGAHCPMLLADYGADVIKVESLEGDPFRAFGLGFLGWNRNKRGIAVDLSTDEGRDIVYHLVRDADVFMENFRIGTSHRLRVDYDTIRQINPRIVYCTVAGWGETGPYSHLPVFDPVFQSSSGAIRAQGGDGDPVFLAPAITDYGASHLAAYAIAAALYSRERTGEGQRTVVTLTGASMAMQSGEFIFPAEGGEFGHALQGGEDFPGPSAAYRSHRCADGFIFIACSNADQWRALAQSIGRPELAYPGAWPAAARTEPSGGIAHVIAAMLAEDTVEKWIKRLAAHGVPCAPVLPLRQVLDSPQVQANGWTVEHEHPKLGIVRQTANLASFSRTPGSSRRTAPLLGQHTDEILYEIGYPDTLIAELREKGVVS
ncbi:MAG TPA: CoA transferase [Dehalococcoidia bacterium]|nr:CoA transferase [Dehalococcoidia bacterium]